MCFIHLFFFQNSFKLWQKNQFEAAADEMCEISSNFSGIPSNASVTNVEPINYLTSKNEEAASTKISVPPFIRHFNNFIRDREFDDLSPTISSTSTPGVRMR